MCAASAPSNTASSSPPNQKRLPSPAAIRRHQASPLASREPGAQSRRRPGLARARFPRSGTGSPTWPANCGKVVETTTSGPGRIRTRTSCQSSARDRAHRSLTTPSDIATRLCSVTGISLHVAGHTTWRGAKPRSVATRRAAGAPRSAVRRGSAIRRHGSVLGDRRGEAEMGPVRGGLTETSIRL